VNRPLADRQTDAEKKADGGVVTPVLAPDPPSAPASDAGPQTTGRSCPRLELDLEPVTVGSLVIRPQVVRLLPEGLVRQHLAVPVRLDGEELVLATCASLDLAVLDQMEMLTGRRIRTVSAPERDVRRAIERFFTVDRSFKEDLGEVEPSDVQRASGGVIPLGEGLGPDRNAPAIRLVDSILRGAARRGASDVHIEPGAADLGVRYRLDGVLHEVMSVSSSLQEEVVSRIKLMSGLDITEHRVPQDGRLGVRIEGAEYDMRVSTVRTVRGEKVAIRLLPKSGGSLSLGQLGMAPGQRELFADLIGHPHGMILLTGPTGSGKTTTLYAALQEVDRRRLNVTTIEDPVEYWLDHVNQIQVNVAAGLTFASALRTVLRQDPDSIMVGEIRDTETARLAVQAAMTGHLVFSTLHANDAASTLARLKDLDVPPFLIVSTVLASISQRLVRRTCPDCREPYEPPKEWLAGTPLEGVSLTHGAGCDLCMNTGYHGRLAVFEILHLTEPLRAAFLEGCSGDALRTMAYEAGTCSMHDAAIEAVANGETTIEEVRRILPPEEFKQ